jgi:anion-transporting  ArsA/GET3 family ATPase
MAEQRTIDLARTKVAELREATARLTAEMDALSARLKQNQEQLSAWLTILRAESPDTERSLQERAAAIRLRASVDLKRKALMLNQSVPADMKMMEATRLFIQSHHGVTPKEITDFLASRGFDPSESFASSALFKMRRRGEVVEQDNRYFWSENQTPA